MLNGQVRLADSNRPTEIYPVSYCKARFRRNYYPHGSEKGNWHIRLLATYLRVALPRKISLSLSLWELL